MLFPYCLFKKPKGPCVSRFITIFCILKVLLVNCVEFCCSVFSQCRNEPHPVVPIQLYDKGKCEVFLENSLILNPVKNICCFFKSVRLYT